MPRLIPWTYHFWQPSLATKSRQNVIMSRPRSPFYERLFARNSNSMEIRLAITPLPAIRSQQIFAHATTAQLCHVHNFVVIILSESRWGWNEISIEFELQWISATFWKHLPIGTSSLMCELFYEIFAFNMKAACYLRLLIAYNGELVDFMTISTRILNFLLHVGTFKFHRRSIDFFW